MPSARTIKARNGKYYKSNAESIRSSEPLVSNIVLIQSPKSELLVSNIRLVQSAKGEPLVSNRVNVVVMSQENVFSHNT